MVKFVTLDAEDVRKAEAYIPIAKKNRAIKLLAAGCVEEVDMRLEGDTTGVQPMPPRWQESTLGKRMVMAYVLAALYLKKVDGEKLFNSQNPEFSFSERQFDIFSQAYSQIDQFKRHEDPEVRAKAFSILSDYRDFEKMLNAEIYNILQNRNDLLARLCMMINMQAAPEALQAAAERLNSVKDDLEKELSAKKEWLERVRKERGA